MILALIRLVALGVLFYIVYRLIASVFSPGGRSFLSLPSRGSDFKCKTCRHCVKLFDDGSLCRYGSRETYKNPTHISNCIDYEKR